MSLIDSAVIACPYCGESVEIVIDCSAGSQEYIEDCYVCCKPICLNILVEDDGTVSVDARSEND